MDVRIVALLAFAVSVQSRDVTVGVVTAGRQIYNETKQASPAIWRQTQNITIAANGTEVISRVVITDLRPDKDGDAKIVDGGEGQKNVTIEMKSPTILRGFEFKIQVFAVPDDGSYTFGNNTEIKVATTGNNSLDAEEAIAASGNDTEVDGNTEVNTPIEDVQGQDKTSEAGVKTQTQDDVGQTDVNTQNNAGPTGLNPRTEDNAGTTGINTQLQDNTGDNTQTNGVTEPNPKSQSSSPRPILPTSLGTDVVVNNLSRHVRDTGKAAIPKVSTQVKPIKEVINEPTQKPRLYSASTRAPINPSTARVNQNSEKPKQTRRIRDTMEQEKGDKKDEATPLPSKPLTKVLTVVNTHKQENKETFPKFRPFATNVDDHIELTTKVGIIDASTTKIVNGNEPTVKPFTSFSKDVTIPESKAVDNAPTLILPSSTIASDITSTSKKANAEPTEQSTIIPMNIMRAVFTTPKNTNTKGASTEHTLFFPTQISTTLKTPENRGLKSEEGKLTIPDAPAVLISDKINPKTVEHEDFLKPFGERVGPKRYVLEKSLF